LASFEKHEAFSSSLVPVYQLIYTKDNALYNNGIISVRTWLQFFGETG